LTGEGKRGLIEHDVSRDDDTVCGEIKTSVALVIGRVAEEDAQCGARCKFMRSDNGEVGIASASERAHVMVGGKSAIESKEGGAHLEGFGGEAVDGESGRGKGITPIGRRHGDLKKEGASDIVESAKYAFSFAILLGGVGARHPKRYTFGKEESTRGGIIKFAAVITLHKFDGAVELGLNMSKKIRESRESVGLKT
jgi:hypothetical protein